MIDLSLNFCGFKLINPFLLASGQPTRTGEMMARGYEAGWAGGVTKTICSGPVGSPNTKPRPGLASLSFAGSSGRPRKFLALESIDQISARPLDVWLEEINQLVVDYPERLTIASITAVPENENDWRDLADKLAGAGAQALEINLDPVWVKLQASQPGGQYAKLAQQVTAWVRKTVTIPILVRLSVQTGDLMGACIAAQKGGATGLTLAGPPLGIVGVDLHSLTPLPNVWGHSTPGWVSGAAVKPLALHALSRAAGRGVVLVGRGGVITWRDALEFLLLGANCVQVATGVMLRGFGLVEELGSGLSRFMEQRNLSKVTQLVGRSLERLVDWEELDTSPEIGARIDNKLCIKCDACRISCRDGGFQAVSLVEIEGRAGSYEIDPDKCTGCSLCYHVCPVDGCITMIPRL